MNAIRFLNLVDEKGVPTEHMEKLRLRGDARKKEFEKILRVAYKKLFDVVTAPQELSNEQLANEFVVQYKLSNRVISAAVPAFLKLCEYAGLREEKQARKARVSGEKTNKGQSRLPKVAPTPPRQQTDREREFDFHIPIVEEKMYIEIPQSLHTRSFLDDVLSNDLRALIKQAHEFAKKHIKDETPDPQKPEGG